MAAGPRIGTGFFDGREVVIKPHCQFHIPRNGWLAERLNLFNQITRQVAAPFLLMIAESLAERPAIEIIQAQAVFAAPPFRRAAAYHIAFVITAKGFELAVVTDILDDAIID